MAWARSVRRREGFRVQIGTLRHMIIHEEAAAIETPAGPMRALVLRPASEGKFPGIVLYSEIFQVTGPIRRTAALIAGHGYLVVVPEIYHELEPAGTVLPYDQAGADKGNANKIAKEISSYDADARSTLDYLKSRSDCTGRLGVMGICIGGHLAFRAAMNPDVLAAACFYATDIHKHSLGKGMSDDSLQHAGEIRGELLHIWGRQDPHVPLEGRNLIKARLEEVGANYQWLEVNAQHAFLRDEGPRYDPALAYQCYGLALELFHRRLASGAVM
jgi:carboxymethylenebutenolidase